MKHIKTQQNDCDVSYNKNFYQQVATQEGTAIKWYSGGHEPVTEQGQRKHRELMKQAYRQPTPKTWTVNAKLIMLHCGKAQQESTKLPDGVEWKDLQSSRDDT